ncbi:hypothetical protein MYP_4083 [Sporocytophaga myxococcoides]|uniref:Uncharacterized protein n=1 Tax=Sporocytophaga myxococcoides TaxID=153721 RepID=A0A098LL76_9BACT|nr:hypothetical protein [Sporocytophaga myxococcoides]GAL86853.1 hypothetical protein MYP_4083 [Sporocytophaga myxococcoides]
MDSQFNIINSSGAVIGSVNHYDDAGYSVVINKKKVAFVIREVDMSTIRKNPFYDSDRRTSRNNPIFIRKDQMEAHARVVVEDGINEEEIKWVTAIGIFESVYHGFDFLNV